MKLNKYNLKKVRGDASSYEIKIIVDLNITENNVLLDKTKIQKQVNYNTLVSKFELKQYENLLINDFRSNEFGNQQLFSNNRMILKAFE